MATVAVRSLVLTVSLACLAFSSSSNRVARQNQPADPDLTAHEWGTFTSVADRSGHAVAWLPLSGFSDLPEFVEHFRTAEFKTRLRGSVRMETPVLYFYTPRETTVSVKVELSQGVITEWYPHASHIEPNPKAVLDDDALYKHLATGSIAWDSLTLAPGLSENFPSAEPDSHYYFARETQATPLIVKGPAGNQREKFLFYRGVSTVPLPISAETTPDGKILVKNLGGDEIPTLMLFERRGDQAGYRISSAVLKNILLDPPDLKPSPVRAMEDLERILEDQGLYADEAKAMIQTWSASWLEEGSHLFYIVPRRFVDRMLPLAINPAPAKTLRVFVGRLELITPTTEQAVERALAHHDRDTIDEYGRFLEPILDQLKAENPARAHELDKELSATYAVQPKARPEQQ